MQPREEQLGAPARSRGTAARSDAGRLIEPLQAALLSLLQRLVTTPSVSRLAGGDETPAQQLLAGFFTDQGLHAEIYDTAFILQSNFRHVRRTKTYAGRSNVAVRLGGAGRGRTLLLNAHMDTVPPGREPWPESPWSGALREGRVHGLGAFDMKAGLVANAAVICALHRAGLRPGGDILFESVVDEEWGGGGGTIAARLRGDTADACVIPEGTQLEIYRATRGGFVVDLVVEAGDPLHYFSSAAVASPAVPLGRLLAWVERCATERARLATTGAYASFADRVPVQVLAVEANRLDPEVPLSVPSRGTVRVYFQFLPEEDVDGVITHWQQELARFCAQDTFFQRHPVEWLPVIGGPLYGTEVSPDDPWLACLQQSARTTLGRDVVTTAAPYPCDAGLLQREFGIPTLLFGPRGAGAHNPGESVEWDSVLQTAETLLTAAMTWTNT